MNLYQINKHVCGSFGSKTSKYEGLLASNDIDVLIYIAELDTAVSDILPHTAADFYDNKEEFSDLIRIFNEKDCLFLDESQLDYDGYTVDYYGWQLIHENVEESIESYLIENGLAITFEVSDEWLIYAETVLYDIFQSESVEKDS